MKIVSITLVTLTQWTGGIFCLYISNTGSFWEKSTHSGTETQSVRSESVSLCSTAMCHYPTLSLPYNPQLPYVAENSQ